MDADYDPLDLGPADAQNRYEEQLRKAMVSMQRSEHGLLFLHWLFAQGHMFASGYVPGDPEGTAHELGKKELVLNVLATLDRANPGTLERVLRRADRFTTGDRD